MLDFKKAMDDSFAGPRGPHVASHSRKTKIAPAIALCASAHEKRRGPKLAMRVFGMRQASQAATLVHCTPFDKSFALLYINGCHEDACLPIAFGEKEDRKKILCRTY